MSKRAPKKPSLPPVRSTTLLVKPDVATGRDPYAEYVRTLPELPLPPLTGGYPGGPSKETVDAIAKTVTTGHGLVGEYVRRAMEISDLLAPRALNTTPRSKVRAEISDAVRNLRDAFAILSDYRVSIDWLAKLALPFKFDDANVGNPGVVAQMPPGPQLPPRKGGKG